MHYVTAKTCKNVISTNRGFLYIFHAMVSVKAPEAFKSRGSILSTTTLRAVHHMDHKKAFSYEL